MPNFLLARTFALVLGRNSFFGERNKRKLKIHIMPQTMTTRWDGTAGHIKKSQRRAAPSRTLEPRTQSGTMATQQSEPSHCMLGPHRRSSVMLRGLKREQKRLSSATGTRTPVWNVRGSCDNHLHYGGFLLMNVSSRNEYARQI